jgi:protein-L-isoaspartate(D-aspartate) O-methyltransferase
MARRFHAVHWSLSSQMPDFAQRRTMMVDTQVRPNDVTKFPIIEAMLAVPREAFLPDALAEAAYMGENIALGAGRVVLEARTLAKMLDALDIGPADRVLDVGCAYGYSAAVIARMAGSVVAVEEDAGMAAAAVARLAAEGTANAQVVTGPLSAGAAIQGPYDAICVQGAVESMPDVIIAQLKDGGRIGCLYMEGALGICRVGHKRDGGVSWRFAFNAGAPVLPGFGALKTFSL